MQIRGTDEDIRANERRKHELAMAKLELQKIKASEPLNEYAIGKLAIKWTGIFLSLLTAGVTICCSIPGEKKPDEVQLRIATLSGVESAHKKEIAAIFARADSVRTSKGESYGKATSRQSDSTKQFRFYEFGPQNRP